MEGGSLPLTKNRLSAFGLEFRPFWPQESPPKKTWVPWAIKIVVKGSASLNRLKNTGVGYIKIKRKLNRRTQNALSEICRVGQKVSKPTYCCNKFVSCQPTFKHEHTLIMTHSPSYSALFCPFPSLLFCNCSPCKHRCIAVFHTSWRLSHSISIKTQNKNSRLLFKWHVFQAGTWELFWLGGQNHQHHISRRPLKSS